MWSKHECLFQSKRELEMIPWAVICNPFLEHSVGGRWPTTRACPHYMLALNVPV